MKQIKFNDYINKEQGAADHYVGVSYLMPDLVEIDLKNLKVDSGDSVIEEIENSTIKQWRYPEPARRLLIYMVGAAGDKLMLTAVIRKIKKLLPDTDIDVVLAPDDAAIFENNKNIRAIKYPPVPINTIDNYDGVLLYDNHIWSLGNREQKNCYAELFDHAGLPFTPDDFIPQIFLKKNDEMAAFSRLGTPDENGMITIERGHIVLSLHTASVTRNMVAPQIVELVKSLHKFLPDTKIYGISNNSYGASIQGRLSMVLDIPNYIPVHNILNIRELSALCRTARCVVTCDSMMAHLPAATMTPTVAIMSTIPPAYRVGTYPFTVSIYKKEQCQYAPCFWKEANFRAKRFEDVTVTDCYTPNRFMCDVMKVGVGEILEAMNEAMTRRYKYDNYSFNELPI